MLKASAVHMSTLALLIAVMVTFSSCSSPNNTTVSSESVRIVTCPTSTVTSVTMSNFLFQPNSVSIAVNDIVTWINDDTTAHTVTGGTPGRLMASSIQGIWLRTPLCVCNSCRQVCIDTFATSIPL